MKLVCRWFYRLDSGEIYEAHRCDFKGKSPKSYYSSDSEALADLTEVLSGQKINLDRFELKRMIIE